MSLDLDRSKWQRVKFGDVVYKVADSGLPNSQESRLYVGLEHMPTDGSLNVTSWGSDVDIVVTKTKVRRGDVLFARRNTALRRVAVAPHDGYFSPDGYAFRPVDERLTNDFLPWLVASSSFMDFAVRNSAGTHSKRVRWSELAKYEFDLPTLADQRRIADLLWALEERQKSLQSLVAGVNGVVDALIGSLTPGVGVVGDVLTMARAGSTPLRSKAEYYGGSVPWLKSGEVSGDAIVSTVECLTQLGLEKSSATLIPAGAVCVAMYGDGKTRGSVGRLGVPMATNQAVLALVPDPLKAESDFLYLWMMSRTDHLRGKSGGAAQKNLSKALVTSEPFPDLSLDEQRSVVERWRQLHDTQLAMEVEQRFLSSLKIAMLERLVSGGCQ